MEKNSRNTWPEIVFGSKDSKKSQAIHRAIKAGELRKISARLYTSNLKDTPEQIIRRNLYHILGEFFPGAILSHRSVKTLSREYIEQYLDKLSRTYGPGELNRVRDKAKNLSEKLHLKKEYKVLDKMIGALLGTREVTSLTSKEGLARAIGIPYDVPRIELFARLAAALKENIIAPIKAPVLTDTGLKNISFFESYFSNYIEGTEFEVSEAADIIFHGRLSPYRPEDAHDILGTFEIVSDLNEMSKTPHSPDELFGLLQKRHAY